jgi:hypothetical protein
VTAGYTEAFVPYDWWLHFNGVDTFTFRVTRQDNGDVVMGGVHVDPDAVSRLWQNNRNLRMHFHSQTGLYYVAFHAANFTMVAPASLSSTLESPALPPQQAGNSSGPPVARSDSTSNRNAIIAGVTIGGSAFIAILVAATVWVMRRQSGKASFAGSGSGTTQQDKYRGASSGEGTSSDEVAVNFLPANALERLCLDGMQKYSKAEIDAALDATGHERLGGGGSATVYKGRLRSEDVAIKVLGGNMSARHLVNELQVNSITRHSSVVILHGYCLEAQALVFEFMKRGSLDKVLFESSNGVNCPWRVRVRIANQVALALNHLHSMKPNAVLHR